MNILFFTHLTDEFPEILKSYIEKYSNINFIMAKNINEYREAIVSCNVLVTGSPKDEDIIRASRLKLIIVPFAGVCHLNLKLLNQKGIMVANSHGNSISVAQRAVALALACCGRVVEFHNDLAKGIWHRNESREDKFDYWFSIVGKNITILGTGEIGRNIAKLLSGFNCNIMGFRKKTESIPEYFSSVTNSLEEALKYGEVIFVALPLTTETNLILNSSNLDLLVGKFVINVGRGDLIEEEPFYNNLKNRKILGAAIDTWYLYPGKNKLGKISGSKFPFHKISSVVVSPHAGSHTIEGKTGQLLGVLDVIERYLRDGWIKNHIKVEY